MFTGIIEEKGSVQSIIKRGKTIQLTLIGKVVLEDIHLGDSIAVDGVCLTVTNLNERVFQVDVMPETFEATALSLLKQGSEVNLERAMAANGRFGGHFVSGHVDCVGEIINKQTDENAIKLTISFPEQYEHLLLNKGSVTLDGTSLTVFEKYNNQLTVSLIPHTSKHTVLADKSLGELVNIEFDMFGKYIHAYISEMKQDAPKKDNISKEFLLENGF